MKPSRHDVPLPPFPPGLSWLLGPEPISERVTARGPLLVHFFEVGELSSTRTLPFIGGLHERLGPAGLTVLGVHSPRNDLATADADLEAALERLGIGFPVANDREHRVWHAYGCDRWPYTFLWRRGGTLRWAHYGEGAYHETESEVREELAAISEGGLPPSVLEPPARGPAPELRRPSPEVFPGGSHDVAWRGGPLIVEYEGAGAWAALGGAGQGLLSIDGEPAETIEVTAPGLYELAAHPAHGAHEVELRPADSVAVWSLSFAPGARA